MDLISVFTFGWRPPDSTITPDVGFRKGIINRDEERGGLNIFTPSHHFFSMTTSEGVETKGGITRNSRFSS